MAQLQPEGLNMKKTYVSAQGERARAIPALQGATVAYSDAVRIDLSDHTLLFVSGKIGTDDALKLADRNMRDQTRQIFNNIKATVEGQGGKITDVVRIRIFVSAIDSQSIREIHDVRREFFKEGEFPASTLIRVDGFVRDDALIEIESDVVIAR